MIIIAILTIIFGVLKLFVFKLSNCILKGVEELGDYNITKVMNAIIMLDALVEIFCGIYILYI